jgi:aminoglycoside phosphotransferase (APT) family kinase protein
VTDPELLRFELVGGGRSNLTYQVTDGMQRWILRRPPLGHVLPTAHDMSREYRVLSALRDTRVPVPAVIALCPDPGVTGAVFYVMEYVTGVVRRERNQTAQLSEDERRRCADALVDVLVELHRVEFRAVGLAGWGRPQGFMNRQVRRWLRQWEHSKTRDLPIVAEIARRLLAAVSPDAEGVIVHGDYRLDNTMFDDADPGRVVAVLDWEMSTLGDPLADLALLLTYWSDPPGGADTFVSPAVGRMLTALPGFPTRAEIAARYARLSGRSIDRLDFYMTFAYLKLAVILEGIHARHVQGKTVGEGFDEVGSDVQTLLETALLVADASDITALAGR